jgi:hypothetical protein
MREEGRCYGEGVMRADIWRGGIARRFGRDGVICGAVRRSVRVGSCFLEFDVFNKFINEILEYKENKINF